MNTPVLKLGKHLIATLGPNLTDSNWETLRERLLTRVGQHRSTGVVIDVSAMDLMDSYATRSLSAIAQMLRLRGAHCVIVGIQPEVAYTMAQLGLRLPGTPTALDLEEGVAILTAHDAEVARA